MPPELDGGALLGRWILGEPMLLYRTADGAVTARADICPHRSARRSAGERDGDNVRCLYHGLEFGADGRCTRVPAQEGPPPDGLRVATYPVAEKWRLIWVWMGAAEDADEALIPDFH
jgi:phenylpropionate dioxygenase-like ring-hydroxylating dioxygenase large terminal subunit